MGIPLGNSVTPRGGHVLERGFVVTTELFAIVKHSVCTNGKNPWCIQVQEKIGKQWRQYPIDQYVEIMNNLKLANPKMMDVAVPANVKGLTLNQI